MFQRIYQKTWLLVMTLILGISLIGKAQEKSEEVAPEGRISRDTIQAGKWHSQEAQGGRDLGYSHRKGIHSRPHSKSEVARLLSG